MKAQINKSRLFFRAHYLVRTQYMSMSQALKQVWREQKAYIAEKEAERIHAERPKINWSAPSPTPDPEYMHKFYSSNCYKGD